MKAKLLVALALILVPGSSGAAPLLASEFPTRVLAALNAQRAAAGQPPLAWDDALGTGAASWAQHLAFGGAFEHSDPRSRPHIGETLWYGTRGAYSVEAMVGAWGAEKRNFVPGVFPNVSRTGNWYDVSHYTQIIWPATTRVGCALASNARTDYLVCRYSPKGNIDGRSVP